ncbi:HD domain-containing protein [Erysipelothrix rhusiopathiae]|uniref:HD domain-containing protein n=1 Tax=Erysipelothrix sp. P66 TaxID=3141531 RepID=UPI001376D380|nr:HD domain-containing protein [Erysipelothrix rhusiopathiae]
MNTSIKFKPTSEHKVLRDPVHGYIHVHHQVIWDLINAPEFQRLRRIHQLGGTNQVYHGAEHSRFSHSVGVYEVVRLMIENVNGLSDTLSDLEHIALLCAGLLHDVGHGPFSHAFESVTSVNHEKFTDRIILEDTQVHKILVEAHPELPQLVADIIAHRHSRKLLTQIISSQLDADRMDYLLRDSYFTGVSYGEFDLSRILRTLIVIDDKLVVKESGIHAVEDYIMARYQMYWQVYLHPTSRSFEMILFAIFERMKDLVHEGKALGNELSFFKPFVSGGEISTQEHFELDESTCYAGFMSLTKSKDPILKDLALRLLNRKLFKYEDLESSQQVDAIKERVQNAGFDNRYYVISDQQSQILYSPYVENGEEGLWVVLKNGTLVELTSASSIVRGFATGEKKQDEKIFYPEEV